MISVLLPYRDAAETIEEAVASLLGQRGVELEILAVDDGSRDGGRAIVEKLGVRSLASGGVGIAGALAAGLAAARGEWIARMDADDVSRPDRLAVQLAALAADERLAAVGTQVELCGGAGAGLARYVAWQNGLLTPDDHARQIFVEAPLCHPSVLLRRAALDQVGGWRDAPWPEDYDLWLRLDAAGWRIAKVPQVLLQWRHRPGRVTFSDPRCAPDRLLAAKAPHLARRLHDLGRPVAVWGAGKTGKRVARALEPHGVRAARFIDIDPRKIGGRARSAPILAPEALLPGDHTVVVAVGEPGARDIVRARLSARGFTEGTDYLCAA